MAAFETTRSRLGDDDEQHRQRQLDASLELGTLSTHSARTSSTSPTTSGTLLALIDRSVGGGGRVLAPLIPKPVVTNGISSSLSNPGNTRCIGYFSNKSGGNGSYRSNAIYAVNSTTTGHVGSGATT